MARKLFFIVLTINFLDLFSGKVLAQNLFQKSYDGAFSEQIVASTVLPNNNIVMVGSTVTDPGGRLDIWLVQVKSDGSLVWSKTIVFPQSSHATAIETSADGNLILAYNVFGNSNSDYTSGWMKLNTAGNILWAKKAIGNSLLTNISKVTTGGYLLCGHNVTASNGNLTGLVVEIDENGEIEWTTVFGENGSSAVSDCWQDALGFIYCCGSTSQFAGDKNGFWAKLGNDGELVSPVRRFGSNQDDALTRIVPMGTDRLLLSGYSAGFSNSPYTAIWTLVTDFSGDLKNSNIFSLPETDLVTNDMIAAAGDQYVMAVGTLPHPLTPAILMKLDRELDQLFAFQYKGGQESDLFSQVLITNNGFTAAGISKSNGDANAYLVSTDVNGQLNNAECCPLGVEIIRSDVTPQTASFVPTQTAFYSVQNILPLVVDNTITPKDLCEPILLTFTLATDTICPGECVEILTQDSTLNVTYSFEIQGGAITPGNPNEICHTTGSVLQVTRVGKNHNCEKKYTKSVALGAKKDHFPNAFTPNGDGSNDIFRPVFGCPARSMNLQIFSRWGAKVFETTDPTGGWDGRVDGKAASSDVYAWKLEYEVEVNGRPEKMMERGEVTLLR